MFRKMLLCGALAAASGCSTYQWTVVETNRPNGTYGDWTTTEVTDEFGSYSFSRAYGQSSNSDLGARRPEIVVQDDFAISMYVGDDYICGDSSIFGEVIWSELGGASLRERQILSLPVNGRDHFEWIGTHVTVKRLMHQLAVFDLLSVRYTDTCGTQRTINFAISGSHHNDTSEIAP